MSSADRLSELRRQRASIAEHLAWLDREIAAAEGRADPARPSEAKAPIVPPNPPVSTPIIAPAVASGSVVDKEADLILEQHRVGTGDIQRDVRRGCFLYFAAALLAVAIGVAVLYFALKR